MQKLACRTNILLSKIEQYFNVPFSLRGNDSYKPWVGKTLSMQSVT